MATTNDLFSLVCSECRTGADIQPLFTSEAHTLLAASPNSPARE